jgi:hypothetical protein
MLRRQGDDYAQSTSARLFSGLDPVQAPDNPGCLADGEQDGTDEHDLRLSAPAAVTAATAPTPDAQLKMISPFAAASANVPCDARALAAAAQATAFSLPALRSMQPIRTSILLPQSFAVARMRDS